ALVAAAPAGAGAGAAPTATKAPLPAAPARPPAPAGAASATAPAPRPAAATPSAPPTPVARPAAVVGAPSAVPAGLGQGIQSGRVKASPLAKKIAAQTGVDLRLIQGSGPGGRIIRRDVEAAGSGAAPARTMSAAAAGAEFEDVPLTQIRAAIARRMPPSHAPVPHFYFTSAVAKDHAW